MPSGVWGRKRRQTQASPCEAGDAHASKNGDEETRQILIIISFFVSLVLWVEIDMLARISVTEHLDCHRLRHPERTACT